MQTIKKHTILLIAILLWSCVSVFASEVRVNLLSSGENAAMFVNAEFAGGTTNTAKFSLYVSPYLVANQGGRYTKHVYIGSQRIVSKLGDLKSYGADPRRIEYAGSESDGPKVDYKTKYALQQQVIKDNFAHFDVPYNGADNNDYVDGKGFSERDGSLKSAMLKAAMAKEGNKSAGLKDNFQQGDSYEQYQYFYHPDHLGSSSFITNTEGEVVQHIEYVPYGEVFIEERNNVWNTPYLFNAKEFDEETGLYYYGARYYDSRLAIFYTTDRYAEKYPWQSAYGYAGGNPVRFIEVNGDSLKVYTMDSQYLFTLDDKSKKVSNCTAKELYNKGIQWFEPQADNYMELIDANSNINLLPNLKHFSWNDVISFGEIDRWMIDYRTGGDGDWKAKGKPGDGYLMVTVDGLPYWTDAIGQVPFTLNKYIDELKSSGNHSIAKANTLEAAMKYGDGYLFGKADNSNSYDNAMVKRAINWASHRYSVSEKGSFEWNYPIKKNGYSPSKMRFK